MLEHIGFISFLNRFNLSVYYKYNYANRINNNDWQYLIIPYLFTFLSDDIIKQSFIINRRKPPLTLALRSGG